MFQSVFKVKILRQSKSGITLLSEIFVLNIICQNKFQGFCGLFICENSLL